MDLNLDINIITGEQIREILDTDGIIIIPGVLNQTECNTMFDGMWNFFEHISQEWYNPISRLNQSTWDQFEYLKPTNSITLFFVFST